MGRSPDPRLILSRPTAAFSLSRLSFQPIEDAIADSCTFDGITMALILDYGRLAETSSTQGRPP